MGADMTQRERGRRSARRRPTSPVKPEPFVPETPVTIDPRLSLPATFSSFLRYLRDRQDAIGELSRAAESDPFWPPKASTLRPFERRLQQRIERGIVPASAMGALLAAWNVWQSGDWAVD